MMAKEYYRYFYMVDLPGGGVVMLDLQTEKT